MSDVECARMPWGAAERDVEALRVMRRSNEIFEEIFGFHVQQAADKAFKAWLALQGETYSLTHNLESLLDLLSDRGAAAETFRSLVDYTPYAVEFRYTGVDPVTESIAREAALALVEALLNQVRGELSKAATRAGGGP